MADETNKCAHEGCGCGVRDGQEYCSPQCEAAEGQDVTEIACSCGHPGCSK